MVPKSHVLFEVEGLDFYLEWPRSFGDAVANVSSFLIRAVLNHRFLCQRGMMYVRSGRWVVGVEANVEADGMKPRLREGRRGYELFGRRGFSVETIEVRCMPSGTVAVGVVAPLVGVVDVRRWGDRRLGRRNPVWKGWKIRSSSR